MKLNIIKGAVITMAFLLSASSEAETLSLGDAEQMALRNNVELKVLRLERKISQESVRERIRAFFPSVSFSYRQNRTIAQREFDNGTYSVQMNVSQPIFDGGKSKLAYEMAKYDQKMLMQKYRQTINQTVFQVRQAFIKLQQSRANVTVARAGFESAWILKEKAELEGKQGVSSLLDLREVQNEFHGRELKLKRESQAYTDQLEDFAMLLNLPPNKIPKPAILDLYRLNIKDLHIGEAELYGLAIRNNQELKQARLQFLRSQKEYNMTRYGFLPKIALTGHYGKTGDEWPPKTTEWGVGFNISFNVFGSKLSNDGAVNRSKNETTKGASAGGQLEPLSSVSFRTPYYKSAGALMKTRKQYRDAKRKLSIQVRRLHNEIKHKKRELRIADEQLAIRELRFKTERLKYMNGDLPVHKLFEEETELIGARLNLIEQRVGYALSVNQLELSLGVDIDTLGIINFKDITVEEADEELIKKSWLPRTQINVKQNNSGSDKKLIKEPAPDV